MFCDKRSAAKLVLSLLPAMVACQPGGTREAGDASVNQVDPPTGVTEQDRAVILAALDRARPGDTIRFAPGTYSVGEVLPVRAPGVTLEGHPEGTTLRGCSEAEFEAVGKAQMAALSARDMAAMRAAQLQCGVFELLASGVTVRGLTFDRSHMGICTNSCSQDDLSGGGHIIEHNVFRNSSNGVRPVQFSDAPTVIRDNIFINTFHAVSGGGSNIHVTGNRISAPSPADMPVFGLVSFAIAFIGGGEGEPGDCSGIVIEDNQIDGHPIGILMEALAGDVCEGNRIRGNVITVARLPRSPANSWMMTVGSPDDPTVVGVPIELLGTPAGQGSLAGRIDGNTIEGNTVLGAEGVGIALFLGSKNQIFGNTVTGVVPRAPFPGNTLTRSPAWEAANGSGIWLSAGSDENDIHTNTFRDVAGPVVVLAGRKNRIQIEPGEQVGDFGEATEVVRQRR